MKPVSLLLFASLMCGIATTTAGSIYKCKDKNGNTVFSQTRCGDDAASIEVKPIDPMYGGDTAPAAPSGNYQAITDRVSNRMTQVRIRNAQNRIKALTDERNAKILGYRKEMMRSTGNAAGIVRNQKYQQLIDATEESYAVEIAAKRAEIAELRREMK